MPNTREKLIELLSFFADGYSVENRHIGDGAKVCEVADHLIANGVTLANQVASTSKQVASSEWIPVTERLPDTEGSYLVYSSKSKTVFTAYYRPQIDRWANRANGQFIAYWMPLPEPPKEVNE